jgi:hypothetical protein
MMTVEVPVPAEDVNTPARNMRQWLDDSRFDPSSFALREIAGHFVVRVRFTSPSEAAAFAERFAGRML